ncbi:MAG: diacylglycerol kinase [Desulfobacteraceae bacterium]|nr:diacylglycerol kinase [Desulfobacteraceae bacterium]
MGKRSRKGLIRLVDATRFSIYGFKAAWRDEAAFRQEVVAVAILVPLAFWLGTTAVERALLIFSALLMLIVELLNSAIEAVVDRIGLEDHPLSGQAKDMGSAAILVTLIAGGAVWLFIAWKRFVA